MTLKLTFPFEDLNMVPGEAIMVSEPAGEEHYITSVTHEQRGDKIVTIVKAESYRDYDGYHREDMDK